MARASTRNFYLLVFFAFFVIISFLLYGSLDGGVSTVKERALSDAQAQMGRLREKMGNLERKLKTNEEELDRLRNELSESENKRKQLVNKQIEKENEIYDEKEEARKEIEKNVAPVGGMERGEEDAEENLERRAEKDKAVVPEPRIGGNKVQVVHGVLSKTTTAKSVPRTDVCMLRRNLSVPHSDIQMFDMYDLLKFDNPDGGVWKQGWEITYESSAVANEPLLEVIVIPHSHCDPGWIRTFEEYFSQQTKNILDGMVEFLPKQEEMSFIYAEISFFEMWWRDLDEKKRQKVKDLLVSGRFELVTGGWVMTDEANAHFHSIIVELMEGHEWIKNHLGSAGIPKSHWSIDPFGLSPSLPFILSAANITQAAVQRVHYSVKKELAKRKSLEFVWRQMFDSSSRTDVRTHIFPFYSYDVPHTCGPDPKVCCQFDFRRVPAGGGIGCPWNVPPKLITENNLAERAETLYDQYRKKAQLYNTNAVLIPLGDDFRYDTSFEWKVQYDNYKQLFEYMNAQKEWNVKARFGTLSDYFSAMEQQLHKKNSKLPVLSGDFFTYADRDDHYWSGYFTSRPFYKQLDRVLQHYLRSAEILFTLARSSSPSLREDLSLFSRLVSARRSLSLFQHHDGVTGTAKDAVVNDYGQKMLSALLDCEEVIAVSVETLLNKKGSAAGQMQLDETRAKHDSLPERRAAEVGSSIVLFNPLSHHRTELACIRVADSKARLSPAGGGPRPRQQLNPVVKFDSQNPQIALSHDEYELCFEAEIGPLSARTFNVVSEERQEEKATVSGTAKVEAGDFTILGSTNPFELKNDHVTVEFDSLSGLLQAVTPNGGARVNANMRFVKYGARPHKKMNSGGGDDLSGAYLFLPDGEARPLPFEESHYLQVKGPLVQRVYTRGSKDLKLLTTYTVDVGAPYVTISNEVDVAGREENLEVAMKIESSVDSGDTLYTDLNGMQMIRRRRRLETLPLQAHFYPMPASAFIESPSTRINLLGAQALGVASLKSGELEVMLERRLLQDDGRGLQQGVMDNRRTVSHFRLLVEEMNGEKTEDSTRMGYLSQPAYTASLGLHYPWVKLLSEDSDLSNSFTGLESPLPCDTHVVTLRTVAAPTDYDTVDRLAASTNSAALVLYRPFIDCRSKLSPPVGCQAGNEETLAAVFGKRLASASSVSLTLLHEDPKVVDRIAIHPQEVKTYKLTF